jgi:ATP-dependent helicase HrpB
MVAADLTALALELAVWGTAPGALAWLDPPPGAAFSRATELLEELGALADGRPTALGHRLAGLPLHPRLATMLLGAGPGARRSAALVAALCSERDILRRDGPGVTADIAERLAVVAGAGDTRPGVDRAALATVRRRAGELVRRAAKSNGADIAADAPSPLDPDAAVRGVDPGPLLAAAYPDRIAQARGGGRYRLRHGGGAVLADHDPLAGAQWLVAAEVDGAPGGSGRGDGRIRLAAILDRADVERVARADVRTETRLEWDDAIDDLRMITERTLDALVLDTARGPARPGPQTTAALLAHALDSGLAVLGWTVGARALQARARWARRTLGDDWPDVSDEALAADAGTWLAESLRRATSRADLSRTDPSVAIRSALGARAHELDRLVPSALDLPQGRRVGIDYESDRPRISARAQDLYGITVHPTIAGRVPVTVEVLSPAGRPIQITADLPSFWRGSWHEVRREMAARYPKHAWPDDPAHPLAATGKRRVR